MALGLARSKRPQSVFVVTGDGELHEGANWEAIMFASQHRLDNLNLVVDDNRIAMLGYTDEIVSNSDLASRLRSFGWECWEVNGHDLRAVQVTLLKSKAARNGKPKAVIARTLKGHGVPGLENTALSHILNPKPELIDTLLEEAK